MAVVTHKTDGDGRIYCGTRARSWEDREAPVVASTYRWALVTCPGCARFNPFDKDGLRRGDGGFRQRQRKLVLEEETP